MSVEQEGSKSAPLIPVDKKEQKPELVDSSVNGKTILTEQGSDAESLVANQPDQGTTDIAGAKKKLDRFLKTKNDAADNEFSAGKNDGLGYSGSLEASKGEHDSQLARVKIAKRQYDGSLEREDIIREYISGSFYKLLLKDAAPEIQLIYSDSNKSDKTRLDIKDDEFAISSAYIPGFISFSEIEVINVANKYNSTLVREYDEIKERWNNPQWQEFKDFDLLKHRGEQLKQLDPALHKEIQSANLTIDENSKLFKEYQQLKESREEIESYNPEIVKNYDKLMVKAEKIQGFEPKKITNLEKVVSSIVFMGDVDPNRGNLGIIPQEDGTFKLAKIDHGRAAIYFYDNENHLRQQLVKIYSVQNGYDTASGMGLNINRFHKAITETIEEISDHEIDQMLLSRISNLKESGVSLTQWSKKLKDEFILLSDRNQTYPDPFSPNSDPKFDSPENFYKFYVEKFKQQRKVMLDFKQTLEIMKQITPWLPKEDHEKFVNGGWLTELGSEDPVIWAKKNNKTFGNPPQDPFDWAKENKIEIKLIVNESKSYSKPLSYPISHDKIKEGKIILTDDDVKSFSEGQVNLGFKDFAKNLTDKIKYINNTPNNTIGNKQKSKGPQRSQNKIFNVALLKTSSLHDACEQDNLELVTRLLALGEQAISKNAEGKNAFDIVSAKPLSDDNTKLLNLLIKDSQDAETPLRIACLNNDAERVRYIITNHSDKIESIKRNGINDTILKILDEYNPQVDNNIQLLEACKNKKYEEVENLLKSGAQIDCKDQAGNTPFHLAFKNQDNKLTEILLRYRLNKRYEDSKIFEIKDNDGNTPIRVACLSKEIEKINKDEEFIKFILDKGVPYPSLEDREGVDKGILAIIDEKALSGGKLAVQAASSLSDDKKANTEEQIPINPPKNIRLKRSQTTKALVKERKTANSDLIEAIKSGDLEKVKDAIKAKANVNKPLDNGTTALDLACEGGKFEVARILIENRANLNNLTIKSKNFLLNYAMSSNFDRLSMEMISKGASCESLSEEKLKLLSNKLRKVADTIDHKDIDKPNEYGLTLMQMACKLKDVKLAKFLIDKGADVRGVAKDLKTLFSSNEPEAKGYLEKIKLAKIVKKIDNFVETNAQMAKELKQIKQGLVEFRKKAFEKPTSPSSSAPQHNPLKPKTARKR